VLWLWGPDELLGPRAPGLSGSVAILGRQFPSYDLFLIVVGPLVLGLVWMLLTRTRFGTLVRAATQDREMVSALGVNQAWLFTAVFALGALLAGFGGALQLPREPAHLEMDLNTIGAAFVVVVVGGMGSLAGAVLASLLIGVVQTFAVALDHSGASALQAVGVNLTSENFAYPLLSLTISQVAPILPYLFLVLILIFRPKGLLGTRED
jgi:branched-chain amino acid transport system permease protein